MRTIILPVVPKPEGETTAIRLRSEKFPIFQGNGDLNYLCGHCSIALAIGVHAEAPIQMTLQCCNCKSYVRLRVEDGGIAVDDESIA